MHQLLPRPSHLCGAPRTKCRAERAAAGVLGGWLLSRKLVSNQWYRLSLSLPSPSLYLFPSIHTLTKGIQNWQIEKLFLHHLITEELPADPTHTQIQICTHIHTHTDTEKHEFAFIQGNHTETIFTCSSQNISKQDYSFDRVFTLIPLKKKLNFTMSSDYYGYIYIIFTIWGSSNNTYFLYIAVVTHKRTIWKSGLIGFGCNLLRYHSLIYTIKL